jgi:hypothetical protein
MPITWDLGGLPEDDPAVQATRAHGGALDADQVVIRFLCSTNESGTEHDPQAAPDPSVRPEHAAFHNTVWRLDDPAAPIPPLDWGCRCAIRYEARPETPAAAVIKTTTSEPATADPKRLLRTWLDKNVEGWQAVKDAAEAGEPQRAEARAFAAAKNLGISREVARVIVKAADVRPPSPMGTGPLAGVGRAGRELAQKALAGDRLAAATLGQKYPATAERLRGEGALRNAPGHLTQNPPPRTDVLVDNEADRLEVDQTLRGVPIRAGIAERDGNTLKIEAELTGGGVLTLWHAFDQSAKVAEIKRMRIDPPNMRGGGASRMVLRNLVSWWDNIDAKRLIIDAGKEDGGFFWARFGMVPDAAGWSALKGYLAKRIEHAPEDVQEIVNVIIRSGPRSLVKLASLPDGRALLRGSQWTGFLDFSDIDLYLRLKGL